MELVALSVVLALVALALVCLPLVRGAPGVPERGQFDRSVYRDQLRDVERDLARGLLSEGEEKSARLEIQRRLLAVDAMAPGRRLLSLRSLRLAAFVMIVAIGGAAWFYRLLGAPSLPDAPYAMQIAQRGATQQTLPRLDIRAAVGRLEQKLRTDALDPEAWVMYARATALLGDWQKAGDAYRHALDLGMKTPDVLAGYGEMLVLAAGGIVPPAAHNAFAAALAADPKHDVARYYLALAESQAGEGTKAIDAWLALAADLPRDSPMRASIARGIAETARASGIPVPPLPEGTPPPPGPTEEQMAAASEMPQAQRDAMIRGMVAKLATHLQSEPGDVAGWLRLGRSYAVLGEGDKAADAYSQAAKLRPGDIDIKLQVFHALITGLQPSDSLPPRALALLHEVAAVAPDQPDVLWYLGIDAARGGHLDVARRNWTRLLAALPPGGEDSRLVKSALDSLPGK